MYISILKSVSTYLDQGIWWYLTCNVESQTTLSRWQLVCVEWYLGSKVATFSTYSLFFGDKFDTTTKICCCPFSVFPYQIALTSFQYWPYDMKWLVSMPVSSTKAWSFDTPNALSRLSINTRTLHLPGLVFSYVKKNYPVNHLKAILANIVIIYVIKFWGSWVTQLHFQKGILIDLYSKFIE